MAEKASRVTEAVAVKVVVKAAEISGKPAGCGACGKTSRPKP